MRRGPKPTKWRDAASAGFAAHFARRSEPLNLPEEAPLAEATGAGLRWIFTGFGEESRQVRIASGGSVRNIALGVTGTLLALGNGETPGEGTCEAYYVAADVEVAADTPGAARRVRGGTGDLHLRLADGRTVWCTAHHCRPWQPSDGDETESEMRPSSPAPPLQPERSPSPLMDDEPPPPAPPPHPPHSPSPAVTDEPPAVPDKPQQTEDAPMEGARSLQVPARSLMSLFALSCLTHGPLRFWRSTRRCDRRASGRRGGAPRAAHEA